jgi:hypothetical protein
MTLETSVAANWDQVIRHADLLDVGDESNYTYLFRGQEDNAWSLKPSLHRAVTNDDPAALLPATDQLLATERSLQEQFRKFAPNYLPAATLNSTHADFDWWTLMRHYGVPTRLLDWTKSFYVALYFACCRLPLRDGAIYVVHPYTMAKAMQAAHGAVAEMQGAELNEQLLRPDAPPVVSFHGRRTALLDRMIVQQGVFMCCHNISGDIEKALTTEMRKLADPKITTLHKVLVPAEQKSLYMRKLRAMNVTGSTLFPGLDGIGRHLDELARNRHAKLREANKNPAKGGVLIGRGNPE